MLKLTRDAPTSARVARVKETSYPPVRSYNFPASQTLSPPPSGAPAGDPPRFPRSACRKFPQSTRSPRAAWRARRARLPPQRRRAPSSGARAAACQSHRAQDICPAQHIFAADAVRHHPASNEPQKIATAIVLRHHGIRMLIPMVRGKSDEMHTEADGHATDEIASHDLPERQGSQESDQRATSRGPRAVVRWRATCARWFAVERCPGNTRAAGMVTRRIPAPR